MNLYLFDVDETLEISGGPIKIQQLINLKKEGHIIGLCGNWAVFVNRVGGWHHLISLFGPQGWPRKHMFMIVCRQVIPADRYIMVGNVNPSNAPYSDKEEAELAGWEFIEERDFKAGV